MDDTSLNKLAIENMGRVKDMVKEFSSKPTALPRKSRSTNNMSDAVKNGDLQPPNVSPKPRIFEKKKKFRKSDPTLVSVADETVQQQVLNKITYESKVETVTKIPPIDTDVQISDNIDHHRLSQISGSLSPEILDSSFDETSDEDELTNRVMGNDAEPEPQPSTPPAPVKPPRSKGRDRSIVIHRTHTGSMSPVEQRKHLKALTESFKPASVSSPGSPSSLTRRYTFTESSPKHKNRTASKTSGSPGRHSISGSSMDSPRASVKSVDGFVYVEPDLHDETFTRRRATAEATPPISSCNELPRSIESLPSDTRHHIIQEIYTSEWTYVNGLEILVDVFRQPLKSVLHAKEISNIFANVEDLMLFNHTLLSQLHKRLTEWTEESTIGDIFITNFSQQHKTMYTVYCNNYDNAESVFLKLLKRRKDVETTVNNCLTHPRVMKGLRVEAFLITPVQRILKYKLLLGDLLKQTLPEHEDYNLLDGALGQLTELAEYMNTQRLEVESVKKVQELQKRMVEIVSISKERFILKEGTVCLQKVRKPYKCVLFNNLLVFALSRDRDSRQIVELQLPLEAIWVDDLKDLDPQGAINEDAIEVYTPERPYRVYTGSKNDKKLWLAAIREAIYNLLLKEEKCHESVEKSIICRKARFVYASTRVYNGEFCDGRRHGFGEIHWPNKTVYKGYWEDDDRCGQGELTYNTGEVYKGTWRDDRQNGIGTLRYNNDDEYSGNWYDGIKHGLGDIKYSNGDKFQGAFKSGQIHGKGKLICANGLTYDGEWLNSQRNGKGRLKFVSGDEYDGEFFNNLICGAGTMKYANGDMYRGQWDKGKRHGKGILEMQNGEVYDGIWDNDMRSSMGTAKFSNGDVYEGLWQHGLRHGKGRLTFANGDIYTGKFDHDMIIGDGEMVYKVGGRYNGSWKNGKHHGHGVMKYFDQATYNGEWQHGLRSGEGEYIAADGTCYSGRWKYDKPHGRGRLITPQDQYVYDGEWVYGLREGKGNEITRSGTHEGEWKENSKNGPGSERSLVGTVYEGKWVNNQKIRGIRKMVAGDQEEQVWNNGVLVSDNWPMTCAELPQLPRIDY